jgi:hypothetical protein
MSETGRRRGRIADFSECIPAARNAQKVASDTSHYGM